MVSISAQTQGQGHETTFAQIVSEELDPQDVQVRHGDTEGHRTGQHLRQPLDACLGAPWRSPRKVRDKARLIAATILETRPGRRPGEGALVRRATRRRAPGSRTSRARVQRRIAPEGMEGGLDAQVIYDPPNLTYPYGAYIAVSDDPETAEVKVRRFVAVDDCGVRINPMIVDGQIHGGRRGHRHRAHGGDHLRRGGQLPERLLHGLPDPRSNVPTSSSARP